jgi:hypothetical protein
VAQEALANVHRYSGSGWARISLRRRGRAVEMTVEDVDAGWRPRTAMARPARRKSGSVFSGMRVRLEQLGGRLFVQAAKSGATRARAPLGDGVVFSRHAILRRVGDQHHDEKIGDWQASPTDASGWIEAAGTTRNTLSIPGSTISVREREGMNRSAKSMPKMERCALRPGNVHSAGGWHDVLAPVRGTLSGQGLAPLFPRRRGLCLARVYKFLEAERIKKVCCSHEIPLPDERPGVQATCA